MIGTKSLPNPTQIRKKGYRPPESKVIRISLLMLLVGVILFALVMIFSTLVLSSIFQRGLIQVSEQWTSDITEILTYEVFTELTSYGNEEFGRSWEEKSWQEEMDGIIRGRIGKLGIIKLKIFNRQGRIIYSTDPEIIGVLDSRNLKLQKALRGEVVSKFEKGQSVWDLAGEKGPRQDMIETYVPIFDLGGQDSFRIVGAFELYRDVNFLVAALNRLRKTFIFLTLGSLFLTGYHNI